MSGSSLAYRRAGAGPTLVLLHGFASDSRAWRPQIEALSTEFTVIAWDAPGAGESPDPPEGFGFDDWADVLARFLDALDIPTAHVLGLSWGGVLAQVFHGRHPERTTSLVLADTYAGWPGSLGAEAAARRLDSTLADLALPPDEFAERFLPTMFGPMPSRDARSTLAELIADRHPIGFRLMALALAQADTRDLARRINVPTLLPWGDHDVRAPMSVGRELEALIPGSRLAVIEGAGHASNLDRPAEFNAVVAEFLRSI